MEVLNCVHYRSEQRRFRFAGNTEIDGHQFRFRLDLTDSAFGIPMDTK
jgi:hypothetical protein